VIQIERADDDRVTPAEQYRLRRRPFLGRLVRFPRLWYRYVKILGGHPLVAFRLAMVLLRPAR
jgi:hypothetical protein